MKLLLQHRWVLKIHNFDSMNRTQGFLDIEGADMLEPLWSSLVAAQPSAFVCSVKFYSALVLIKFRLFSAASEVAAYSAF